MAKPKASSIILIVALLVSSLAAAVFYMGKNDEHAKRVWTENQLQKITEANETLEKEREELAKAKEALELQLTDATTQAKALAEQFAQEKRAKEALTAELVQVRKDANQVKGQLESERKEKQTLADDLGKAKQSYQALNNELTTLRQAKEALEKRVKEMLTARAKEAEQIVVKPSKSGIASGSAGPRNDTVPVIASPAERGVAISGVEAKVLVVNREYNFVVLSVGSKDGVHKGSRLAILRDGRPVVTVEADRVYDNMTAANLLEEAKKGDVKEGDVARLIS